MDTKNNLHKDMSKSFYWNKQYVNKIQINKKINKCIVKLNKMNLKKQIFDDTDLIWKKINPKNINDVDKIFNLIDNNYVQGTYKLVYSKKFITFYLNYPDQANWHMCIYKKSTDEIIGFMAKFFHDIFIIDKKIKIMDNNFLCIKKEFRGLGLNKKLIDQYVYLSSINNINQSIYTSAKKQHVPISEIYYYQYYLNIDNLVDMGFLNKSWLKGKFLFKVKSNYSLYLQKLKIIDLNVAFVFFMNCSQKYKIYFCYTKNQFHYLMFNDIINVLVIKYKKKIKVFIAYFNMKYKTIDDKYIYISQLLFAHISHYNDIEVMNNVLTYINKNTNSDIFHVINNMNNIKYLMTMNFFRSNGKLFYYLYNWLCPSIHPSNICLPIF